MNTSWHMLAKIELSYLFSFMIIQPSSCLFKMPCWVSYERFYQFVTRNTKLHINHESYVGLKLVLTCMKHMYIIEIGMKKTHSIISNDIRWVTQFVLLGLKNIIVISTNQTSDMHKFHQFDDKFWDNYTL